MKLRSGRYKWLTRPMSINEIIPNEMLEMILLKLPTKDLLQCRSVSKLWKAFASYICRRRYVAVNLRTVFYNASKTEAFYDTFQDTSDLPWSASVLYLCNREPLNPEELKRFLDTFGPSIRKLKLHAFNLEFVMPALMQMPNLEILISIYKMDKNAVEVCSGNRLNLSKLKHLDITVSSSAEIELIELICTNTRNLQSILVNFRVRCMNRKLVTLEQADLRRLIGTISRIPSIALSLPCNGNVELIQALMAPQLTVKELILEFVEQLAADQYYRALEQLLAGNSNCLEKLKIRSWLYKGETTGQFCTPVLSKLKELDLALLLVSSTNCHIYPFTPNQFPILRKITVGIREGEGGVNAIFETAQFDSVQELILHANRSSPLNNGSNPMSMDWSRIFPNLVTLDLNGVTVESYSYIYQRMGQLQHLSLTVHVSRVTDRGSNDSYRGDSTSILSQYPKDAKKKNRGTVAQTQSLASLTNLKTLTLNFWSCDDIPDSKVHLALLKVHPLDCLTFQNIEISSEVKEKLSNYHGNIKVQPKYENNHY